MTSNNSILTVNEIREYFTYDPESGLLRWKHRPWVNNSTNSRLVGKVAGTPKKGYVQIAINLQGRAYFFLGHRIAWAIYYNEWPEALIDHIDGDGMNNRISNLRSCDHAENSKHKREVRGKLPFKGVYYFSRDDKYAAQIKNEKQWQWLGLHDTAEDAAKAYDCAAIQLHGEFAITNEKLGLI